MTPYGWNRIANHPEVRPFLGPPGELDLTEWLGAPGVHCFDNGQGGYVLHSVTPGGYEIHVLFEPNASTRGILSLLSETLLTMFLDTDCDRVLAKMPVDNKRVIWLANRSGFKSMYSRKDQWPGGGDMVYMDLTLDRWLAACSTLEDLGSDFARGLGLPEEPVQTRFLGGAMSMFARNNAVKGVNTYNMWAAFNGQPQMTLVTETPLAIGFMGQVWELDQGKAA